MVVAGGKQFVSRRWLVAIAVMSSAIMEVLDTSVVNVSLPHISGSLSSTVDEATWVLTSYIVANAIILPISGWLSNYFGRKRLLMTVVTGFTVSSVLCGMAPSLPLLIFFRVMQGTTGGGLQPLSQAVLLEEFPPEERGKAMSLWGLGIVAAPVLGPTLGGWITDNFTWRWVFYINLPIGIISLIMIYLFVSDPSYIRRGTMRFDAWGMAMLAIGMGALQITLDKGQEDDWFGSGFIRTLAVTAAVMLTVFIIRELKTKQPLVKLSLFRYRTFATGIGIVMVLGFVLYGSLVSLPLFMQELLGWNAQTAGFWTSPRGIATAVCMPLVGYLLGKRWDPRWMVVIGCLIGSMAFFGYSRMDLNSGTWDILGHQINQGVGQTLLFVPLTILIMDPIPKEEIPYATSLYSVMRNIGSSMGISFVTTLVARRSQFHQMRLGSNMAASNAQIQQAQSQLGAMFALHGAGPAASTHQALGFMYRTLQQQATLLSYIDVFRVMGWLFLLTAPLVLMMRKKKREADVGVAVH
jgi:MFS transporter, DHA2 family, multidrug resistance protein